jgi:hypothetical protein
VDEPNKMIDPADLALVALRRGASGSWHLTRIEG